jgi:hypothetical protein
VTVDRRPLGATVSAARRVQPVAVLALSVQLAPSEREAKAVSAGYSEERGLKGGSYGEIVNERGRTVFKVTLFRLFARCWEIDCRDQGFWNACVCLKSATFRLTVRWFVIRSSGRSVPSGRVFLARASIATFHDGVTESSNFKLTIRHFYLV